MITRLLEKSHESVKLPFGAPRRCRRPDTIALRHLDCGGFRLAEVGTRGEVGPGGLLTGRIWVPSEGYVGEVATVRLVRNLWVRYSTVTVLARLRGWSTSHPRSSAMW